MAIATNFDTSSSIASSLSYGSNPNRKGNVVSVNCNPKTAARDFNIPFELYGKGNDDVKVHRLVLGFANDDKGKCEVNDSDSRDYVQKFINVFDKHLGNNYPIIAYQHLNTEHMHYHIYIGACGFDGKKFHPKQNPITLGRRFNSRLASQYGLKQMSEYKYNYKNEHQFTDKQIADYAHKHHGYVPYSYKDSGRYFVSKAILNSHDLNSFRHEMNRLGCRVSNNIYSDTKMLNIYIPFRYKNGMRKKGQEFRNLRSRTLGKSFTKHNIKQAIYSRDDNNELFKSYHFFARPIKTVKGGNYVPTDKKIVTSPHRMKGVRFKDERINIIRAIEGKRERTGDNSRKIDNNSVHLEKQESNYRRNGPQVKKAPRVSSSNSSLTPDLNGLSQIEREEVLEDEKFLRSLSNLLDGLLSSFQTILPENENKPHHEHHEGFPRKFFDREVQIKRNHDKQRAQAQDKPFEDNKTYKDHRITRDEFIRKLHAQRKENRRKLAREREDERSRQQSDSEESKSLSPNEQRKRYNKEHPHRSNHMKWH